MIYKNILSRTQYDNDGMQRIQNFPRAVDIYILKVRKVSQPYFEFARHLYVVNPRRY